LREFGLQVSGKSCGKNCVFKVEIDGLFGDGKKEKTIIARPSRYNEAGFSTELKEVERLINEGRNKIDLDFLEKRAEKIEPNDFYYKNADKVTIGGGLAIE
jgi:hypothetical protein